MEPLKLYYIVNDKAEEDLCPSLTADIALGETTQEDKRRGRKRKASTTEPEEAKDSAEKSDECKTSAEVNLDDAKDMAMDTSPTGSDNEEEDYGTEDIVSKEPQEEPEKEQESSCKAEEQKAQHASDVANNNKSSKDDGDVEAAKGEGITNSPASSTPVEKSEVSCARKEDKSGLVDTKAVAASRLDSTVSHNGDSSSAKTTSTTLSSTVSASATQHKPGTAPVPKPPSKPVPLKPSPQLAKAGASLLRPLSLKNSHGPSSRPGAGVARCANSGAKNNGLSQSPMANRVMNNFSSSNMPNRARKDGQMSGLGNNRLLSLTPRKLESETRVHSPEKRVKLTITVAHNKKGKDHSHKSSKPHKDEKSLKEGKHRQGKKDGKHKHGSFTHLIRTHNENSKQNGVTSSLLAKTSDQNMPKPGEDKRDSSTPSSHKQNGVQKKSVHKQKHSKTPPQEQIKGGLKHVICLPKNGVPTIKKSPPDPMPSQCRPNKNNSSGLNTPVSSHTKKVEEPVVPPVVIPIHHLGASSPIHTSTPPLIPNHVPTPPPHNPTPPPHAPTPPAEALNSNTLVTVTPSITVQCRDPIFGTDTDDSGSESGMERPILFSRLKEAMKNPVPSPLTLTPEKNSDTKSEECKTPKTDSCSTPTKTVATFSGCTTDPQTPTSNNGCKDPSEIKIEPMSDSAPSTPTTACMSPISCKQVPDPFEFTTDSSPSLLRTISGKATPESSPSLLKTVSCRAKRDVVRCDVGTSTANPSSSTGITATKAVEEGPPSPSIRALKASLHRRPQPGAKVLKINGVTTDLRKVSKRPHRALTGGEGAANGAANGAATPGTQRSPPLQARPAHSQESISPSLGSSPPGASNQPSPGAYNLSPGSISSQPSPGAQHGQSPTGAHGYQVSSPAPVLSIGPQAAHMHAPQFFPVTSPMSPTNGFFSLKGLAPPMNPMLNAMCQPHPHLAAPKPTTHIPANPLANGYDAPLELTTKKQKPRDSVPEAKKPREAPPTPERTLLKVPNLMSLRTWRQKTPWSSMGRLVFIGADYCIHIRLYICIVLYIITGPISIPFRVDIVSVCDIKCVDKFVHILCSIYMNNLRK